METLQNQNVLLFTRTMGLGGTENVVLQLCEILNPVVNKVVVCSCGGVNEKRLQTMGIKHYTIPDIEKKDLKTIFSTLSQVKKIVKKEEILSPAKTESMPVQQQPSVSAYPDSASYKITGTKTKYTIKEGETLTRVSLRFYGTKAMWPYIVKHNPDVIKNPNNVPYGTTIKIPELTKE